MEHFSRRRWTTILAYSVHKGKKIVSAVSGLFLKLIYHVAGAIMYLLPLKFSMPQSKRIFLTTHFVVENLFWPALTLRSDHKKYIVNESSLTFLKKWIRNKTSKSKIHSSLFLTLIRILLSVNLSTVFWLYLDWIKSYF